MQGLIRSLAYHLPQTARGLRTTSRGDHRVGLLPKQPGQDGLRRLSGGRADPLQWSRGSRRQRRSSAIVSNAAACAEPAKEASRSSICEPRCYHNGRPSGTGTCNKPSRGLRTTEARPIRTWVQLSCMEESVQIVLNHWHSRRCADRGVGGIRSPYPLASRISLIACQGEMRNTENTPCHLVLLCVWLTCPHSPSEL